MPPPPDNTLAIVIIVGAAIAAWYLFQVGSRKKEQIRYKVRKLIVALPVYLFATMILLQQRIQPLEAIMLGVLAGVASAEILVSTPKRSRCIPPAIRREVIARDLTSKGLKWDRTKHHIDHIVPYSRGGDHSARNLRVIEKKQNLRKGAKMPGLRDFLD